jgi:hypothetical protein
MKNILIVTGADGKPELREYGDRRACLAAYRAEKPGKGAKAELWNRVRGILKAKVGPDFAPDPEPEKESEPEPEKEKAKPAAKKAARKKS